VLPNLSHYNSNNFFEMAEDSIQNVVLALTESEPNLSPKTTSEVQYVEFLENKLNEDIGWYYWKKYIAAAFWSQISMPMNLVITLITALTTAQANAPNLLPEQIYKNLTYVSLLLTVLNTFFRPHEKLQNNIKYMKEWNSLGIAFEKIYYSDINNSSKQIVRQSRENMLRLATEYNKLQDSANALRQKEGPDMMNFVTDLLFIICYYSCMKNNRHWLEQESSTTSTTSCCCRQNK
jgi:uncharacterized membrane protein YcgQ (UPF0703/DUF1980 family)